MRRERIVSGAIGGLAALAALGGAAAVEVASAAPAPHKPAPGLARFDSCRAFLGHVRRHTMDIVGPYGLGTAPVMFRAPSVEGDSAAAGPSRTSPVAGEDFSDTNVQEAGVDEPDMVKTDGRTIFSLANGRLQAVDVTGSTPRVLPGLDLDDVYASSLILVGDRLLVLGDGGGGGGFPTGGDVVTSRPAEVVLPRPSNPSTVIVQLDVADPAHPRVLARMRVDGSLVSARRTEGTVRVVLSSSPTRLPLVMSTTAEGKSVRAATRANRRIVARANATAWLPRLTLRDVAAKRTLRRPAVRCASISRPTQFAGIGMLDVLTLGVTGTLSLLDSDAVMSDGELVYASPTAMYIATTRWAEPVAGAQPPSRGTTLIHKLDTAHPARTTYRASGSVRGYLLNQFAMSEEGGYLRTASTEEPVWWEPPSGSAGASESRVTVLAEVAGRLQGVGEAGGLGRGERIKAVRFLGARGYVVTFRQTDPLYAIDLSDPARPTVRGALKIPGFSSYLHPIDANTLIGVGQAADEEGRTEGTQVSLFDVSNLDAPVRIAQRELDTDWSEAESDHHAFLYWAPTRTLVLPAQSYGGDGRPTFLGAVGLTVARDTGITPIARVRHPGDEASWSPVRRSLVVGDALYTVSDTGVMASALATLEPRGWARFR